MIDGGELIAATSRALIFPSLSGSDARSALEWMAREIARVVPAIDEQTLARALVERESLGSTAVGGGIAIPHCRIRGAGSGWLAVGRHSSGVPFGALDGNLVHLLFVVLAPLDAPAHHLRLLAAIARLARRPGLLDRLRSADGVEGIVEALGLGAGSFAA